MYTQLSGATRLFPMIGDPIIYAESPGRFSRTLADREYEGLCVPMHVPHVSLDAVMAGLFATENVDGILVTMPHKFNAFAYCTSVSERAGNLGVVSVMRRNRDRSWHGDMLDGLAFVEAQKRNGASIEGQRALLLGAGGAGRAIALALLEAGIGKLIICDVDTSRVAELLNLTPSLDQHRITSGSPDPRGCDLVFNATPMGMNNNDPLPVDAALLSSTMFVGDVIAGHGVTPLIRVATEIGCKTADGNQMVEAVQSLMTVFMLDGYLE
jgi:shikimate dehydrogenase